MQLTCICCRRPFFPLCYLSILILLLVRFALAALFLVAGILHLRRPRLFLPIMPPWIPLPAACVLVSGIFELFGGVGLLISDPAIQLVAGWGLVALLIAVFPANIYMAVAGVKVNGFPPRSWMAWARLPLQPVLVLAVLWVTHSWPGKCKTAEVLHPLPTSQQKP